MPQTGSTNFPFSDFQEFIESKVKKPRKNKKSKKEQKEPVEDSTNTSDPSVAPQDDANVLRKPQLTDTLPCQLYRLCKYSITSIPSMIRWIILEIENWKESRKLKEEEEASDEEEEEEEDEDNDKPKRRQRIDPALYEYDRTNVSAAVSYTASQNVTDTRSSAASNGQIKKVSLMVLFMANHTAREVVSLRPHQIYLRSESRLEKMQNFPGIWSKIVSKM